MQAVMIGHEVSYPRTVEVPYPPPHVLVQGFLTPVLELLPDELEGQQVVSNAMGTFVRKEIWFLLETMRDGIVYYSSDRMN